MSAFTQKIHEQFKHCSPPSVHWTHSEHQARVLFLNWLSAFLKPAFDAAKLPDPKLEP